MLVVELCRRLGTHTEAELAGHHGDFGLPKELFLHTPITGKDKEGRDGNFNPDLMVWAVQQKP